MSRYCECAGGDAGSAAAPRARRTLVRVALVRFAFVWCLPLAWQTTACQSKPPDRAPPLAAQSPPKHLPAAVAKAGAAEPTLRVTFEAETSPAFVTSKDLLDLEDGALLSRQEFDLRSLGARSPQAKQACQSGSLLLVLDDQSPRPLLQPTVPLESVVDEDRELSPGWHVLVAFVRSPELLLLQVVRFQLETDQPRSPSDSQCALLEPAGTVGLRAVGSPAAGSLRLLAAPLAAETKQFEYFLGQEPTATFRTQALEPVRVLGLPPGDHRLGVRCYDGAGVLVGESERTVTVNLDAEFGKR